MSSPWPSLLTMPRERVGNNGSRGLVLVELLFILLVLVLAGVLLFMGLGRIRHKTRLDQLGADMQTFSKVFEQAWAENGRWPATTAEAASRLQDGRWADGSGFGGEYGWVPPSAAGRPGMITLTAFSPSRSLELTPADLLALDRRIDDGNLATGRFRTGFNGWPVYLVGDKP